MTIVIAIQGLVAALAILLVLEARTRSDGQDDRGAFDTARADEIVFHPELIVAWDDEANHAHQSSCTRSASADRHELRRPSLVSSRQHLR